MQHSRFLTTLTPETLNLIHQLPIVDANDIGKLSETFDLMSLMLDTGATEHEIWQGIAFLHVRTHAFPKIPSNLCRRDQRQRM